MNLKRAANWLDPCLELAWAGFGDFTWVAEHRPSEYSTFVYQSNKGDYRMDSSGWVEKEGRLNLRWTRLQGASLDIATLMCYPTNRPDLLPVYAFEWVVVGGRGHAMICDVEVCGPHSRLEQQLQKAFEGPARTYRSRLQPRERPEWFEEIAQPHAQVFTADAQELDTVFQLQQDYQKVTVDLFYRPILQKEIKGGPDHNDVRAYKIHHAENSPGTKMLEKWLGQEKSREFLYEFHFGPSGVSP